LVSQKNKMYLNIISKRNYNNLDAQITVNGWLICFEINPYKVNP
jgi:hypothetical protein